MKDAGPGDTQPPPPPEFVIDEKAVEERKKKELQEMEQLNKKMKETSITDTTSTSKQSKHQTPGGKTKGSKPTGANKKAENLSSYDTKDDQTVQQKKNDANEKQKTQVKVIANAEKCGIVELNKTECKKQLTEIDKVIARLEQAFKTPNLLLTDKTKISDSKSQVQPDSKNEEKNSEKSKEEIKAEREAKKKAKQAAKEQAKNKSTPAQKEQDILQGSDAHPSPLNLNDKSNKNLDEVKTKEDIKAEREAKKQAKQAARALAKEKIASDDTNSNSKDNSSKNAVNSNSETSIEPKSNEGSVKSKAELKAERRAKQEAQRAAKANAANQKSQGSDNKSVSSNQATAETSGKSSSKRTRVPDDRQVDRASVEKKILKKLASQNIPSRTVAQRKVKLFDHLHQYEREYSISKPFPVVNSHIHPAVLQLGLRYAEGSIQGSNARCLAFMHTIKQLISDYKLKANSGDSSNDLQNSLRRFSENLGGILDTHITFLKNCRTHSVSMGNAIRLLKAKIKSIGVGTGMKDIEQENQIEERAKLLLFDSIDTFVDQVRLAAVQISDTACNKIKNGDVILTYGCSSLLREVFSAAAKR